MVVVRVPPGHDGQCEVYIYRILDHALTQVLLEKKKRVSEREFLKQLCYKMLFSLKVIRYQVVMEHSKVTTT